MYFFTFSILVSAIVNAVPVNSNNVFTGYFKDIQNLQSLLNNNKPFVTEFDSIKDILITGKINGIPPNVPEKEANEIIHAVQDSKTKFENFLITFVASKATEESKKEIHMILKDLSQIDNLEQTLKDNIDTAFSTNPEYLKSIQFTLATIPEPLQIQVLDYINYFVTSAHESDPAVADALINVIEWTQDKYQLFPEKFYTKLQATLNKAS